MNLRRRFAAVLVMLALVGCTQPSTRNGQPPAAPYLPENAHDRGGDGGGEGMMSRERQTAPRPAPPTRHVRRPETAYRNPVVGPTTQAPATNGRNKHTTLTRTS